MRLFRPILALLFLAIFGSACLPAPTPTPAPSAAYLGTTPAYEQWVRHHVQAYWALQPGNGVIPLIFPLSEAVASTKDEELELMISGSQPPQGWFATPLIEDAIAVIVQPDLELEELSREQLYEIFFGQVQNWSAFESEDVRIEPIIPLEGDELRVAFQAEILRAARFTSNAILAPNPQAALERVLELPGGIAIVPWTALTEDVDPLEIDGVGLSDTTIGNRTYPLRIQVYAFAPQEPSGVMREFVGWLQEQVAQP